MLAARTPLRPESPMATQPIILAVDEDRANQSIIAPQFNLQGHTYRFITDRRKLSGGLKQLNPDLLIVVGELTSDFVIQVLDTLALDLTYSTRPVIVICRDQADAQFVKGFRSGVIAMLPGPLAAPHVDQITAIWNDLASRQGLVSGTGDGKSLTALMEHVRRTRRSGVLVISPRTPNEGRATFVHGKLERARFLGATNVDALRAMAQLPQVNWTFAEVAGRQGDGAGVVIEVGDVVTGETEIAEITGTPLPPALDEPLAFEVPTAAPPAPVVAAPAGKVQLLLVDDDEAILRMFSALFAKHGFDVSVAKDGQAGAELALQKHFDLVFADLNMPHLDGWGMLRLLRDDYRTRELPVAFVSAHDDYRESLRALDAGAQAYVSKGTRLDALVAQARKLLEPRSLVQAHLAMGNDEPVAIQIHGVGPQWLLHQLALDRVTGTLSARDGWAAYTVVFVDGACVHASAVAGKYTAEGERAFNAFIGTRAAEGEFTRGPSTAVRNLFLATDVLLERAATTLNDNERRLRESMMVQATQVEVNKPLYDVYRQVGPREWLECARLICEENMAPRDIISKLELSPLDIEETMKDLIRRGVVTLKKA